MGAKNKVHKFCKTCGSSIMIDPRKLELGLTDTPEEDTLAVNVYQSNSQCNDNC